MASDREPSAQWELENGQAWVFASSGRLVTPLVLAADVQDGPTDMAALVAGLTTSRTRFCPRCARRVGIWSSWATATATPDWATTRGQSPRAYGGRPWRGWAIPR